MLTRGGYPLGGEFSPFFQKNILEQEYNIAISLFFEDTIRQKKKKKIQKNHQNYHNCLLHEWVLKIFYFHVFEYCQILANFTYGGLPLEQKAWLQGCCCWFFLIKFPYTQRVSRGYQPGITRRKKTTTRILHLAMNALTNYTTKTSQIFNMDGFAFLLGI
jgi:hypothetical protein